MERIKNPAGNRAVRVIFIISVCAVLLFAVLRFFRAPADYSTGDALFDRLQAEIQHNMRGRGKSTALMSQFAWPAAPDISVVESWEAEFGERSDYWCLLAVCHSVQQGGSSLNRGLLERAARCADSGSAVHGRLMEMRLQAIRMDRSLDAWQEDEKSAAIIMEYRERFPDSAWVCYLAADHLAYYGMTAEYVEMLELGNSLDEPGVEDPFPVSYVLDGMADGGFRGDPQVAGSILRMCSRSIITRMGGMIRPKDQYKEMLAAGTDLGMVRGLNALYRRELRCWEDDPLPTVLSPAVFYLANEGFTADLPEGQTAESGSGFELWRADCSAFIDWNSAMTVRLQTADPELARVVLPGSPEMGLPGQRMLDPGFGIVDSLLNSTIDRGRLSRHLAYTEYEYTSYMLEYESPVRISMLEHLATFDFEHPELYERMDDHGNQAHAYSGNTAQSAGNAASGAGRGAAAR